jgi:hypothetical protein
VYLYKEHKQRWSPQLDIELESLLKGYQRLIAQMKATGKVSIREGKEALSFEGYKLLALKLLTHTAQSHSNDKQLTLWKTSIFGWPYILMQWNMMARSESISLIRLDHVGWSGDCMVVHMPKTKTDQEGMYI